MFRMSAETYDDKVIWYRDKEVGFWVEYAKILGQEQFRDVVSEYVKEFKIEYPDKKMPIKVLKSKLAIVILQDGWKPTKSLIIKEVRRIRKIRREEILCLRKGMTKKNWQKHLKQRKLEVAK